MHFGIEFVKGLSLAPSPAASRNAFIIQKERKNRGKYSHPFLPFFQSPNDKLKKENKKMWITTFPQ